MEIEEFHADLLASAGARAEALETVWREAFVIEVIERLNEANEIPEAEPCVELLTGPNRAKIELDAQVRDDADDSLHLFVAIPYGEADPPRLNASDLRQRGFDRLKRFIDNARSGWITQNIEESRPAWPVADQICRGVFSAIRLHVLSDRPISERVTTLSEERLDDGTLLTFQVWDLNRLKRIHDAAQFRDDLVVDLTGLPGGGLKVLKATHGTKDYDGYLAVIPADHLARIYTQHGSRLLEGNVRTFLGRRGNVNKGIQKTINEEPERFFAYNNGIAATASDVETQDDGGGGTLITSATDFQIVNGAQTTASLASALRENKLGENHVFVQVKLSVVPPAVAEELMPRISRYANSQNAVKASDFFANHPFHRRVEQMSRRILAPAVAGSQIETHWYYERARGQFLNDQARMTKAEKTRFQKMNPKSQVITKTDLGKVETCFEGLPDTACRGAEKAFIHYAEKVTQEWRDEKKKAGFSDDWFREMVARVILFRKTEKIISAASWYTGGYRAQAVAYTCARLARLAETVSDGGKLDYRRIWDKQGVDDALHKQMDTIAERMMQVLWTPPQEGQNISEWAKKQACREQAMKTPVEEVQGFRKWVVDKEARKAEQKDTQATGMIDDDVRRMQGVLEISPETWRSLRQFARQYRLLVERDESALRAACRETRNPPNEIQAKALYALLKRATDRGWVAPEPVADLT